MTKEKATELYVLGGILILAAGASSVVMYFTLMSAATNVKMYTIQGSGCQAIAWAEDSVIVKCNRK